MVTILLDTMYINYVCVLLPNCGVDLSPLNNNPHATLMFYLFYLLQKNGNKIIGHMPFINAKCAEFS